MEGKKAVQKMEAVNRKTAAVNMKTVAVNMKPEKEAVNKKTEGCCETSEAAGRGEGH